MKNIIFFLIIYFFFSCKKERTFETIEFRLKNDISIPCNQPFKNSPESFEIFKADSCTILFYYIGNEFFIYNIDKSKYISNINLQTTNIYCAKLINLDSIFFLTEYRRDSIYRLDSTLFLSDYKGNKYKYYSSKGIPGFNSEHSYTNIDSLSAIANSFYFPYNNNEMYLSFIKWNCMKYNDSNFHKVKLPIGGKLNMKKNKISNFNLFQVPDLDNVEKKLSKEYLFSEVSYIDNSVIYSFWYTPTIYKYDLNTGKNTVFKINSHLINDTVFIIKKGEIPICYYKPFENLEVFKKYLRLAFINSENKYTAVILDNNLNIIGEALYPQEGRFAYWHENELYMFNEDKTYASEGKIVFSVYEAEFKQVNKAEFIAKHKIQSKPKTEIAGNCNSPNNSGEGSDTEAVKTHLSKTLCKNTYRAVVVPTFESCPSCVEYVLANYGANYAVLSQMDIYLVLLGKNKPAINEKLKQYNIPLNSPMIINDTSKVYIKSLSSYSAQHIFMVRNDTLLSYKNYEPANLESLMFDLISGTEYKVEKKKN